MEISERLIWDNCWETDSGELLLSNGFSSVETKFGEKYLVKSLAGKDNDIPLIQRDLRDLRCYFSFSSLSLSLFFMLDEHLQSGVGR